MDRTFLVTTDQPQTVTVPTDPDLLALQAQVAKLIPPTPPPTAPVPDPPRLNEWRTRILAAADIHAAEYFNANLDGPTRLGLTYYDASLGWKKLAEYFRRPDYLNARDEAVKIYRDGYVLAQPTPGAVAGIEIFAQGLFNHYLDTKDERSKTAVLAMADHAAFSSVGEITSELSPMNLSREAAYTLECKLYATDLGGKPMGIPEVLTACLGHLAQWTDLLTGKIPNPSSAYDPTLQDCRAFMVGLSCHALIKYYRRTPDPAIRQAVVDMLNLLWQHQYLPDSQSFAYTDRTIPQVGDRSPSNDVNLLIAPAYAWIGQRERADLLFAGSLTSYLVDVKQFNQQIRWVWEYFEYRKQ